MYNLYVSDGTAITAETVGNSLVSQFDDVEFTKIRIPFCRYGGKSQAAAQKLKDAYVDCQPLVINTVVDIELRRIIHSGGGLKLDPFQSVAEND